MPFCAFQNNTLGRSYWPSVLVRRGSGLAARPNSATAAPIYSSIQGEVLESSSKGMTTFRMSSWVKFVAFNDMDS